MCKLTVDNGILPVKYSSDTQTKYLTAVVLRALYGGPEHIIRMPFTG